MEEDETAGQVAQASELAYKINLRFGTSREKTLGKRAHEF
jgi:hypothetical protein